MDKNIEIKAYLSNLNSAIAIAKMLSGAEPEVLHQEDTFFNCANGRLKLRKFSEASGELIFYQRPNSTGPKLSEYAITVTNEPDKLLLVLTKAHGIYGKVSKTRQLFRVGRTRVHIDDVQQLGHFLELEVVLTKGEDLKAAKAEAIDLLAQLGISQSQTIDGAYVDLIHQQAQNFLNQQ